MTSDNDPKGGGGGDRGPHHDAASHPAGDQWQAAAVENAASGAAGLSQDELDELVASSDTGARTPAGWVGATILTVAFLWSLFQIWIASPLPFMLNWGILNDTDTRSIHLAFAMFLAYLAYPAERSPTQLALAVGVPAVLTWLFIASGPAGSAWWLLLIGAAIIAAILLGSPRNWVPPWEWAMALVSVAAALYIYVFYDQIAMRIGKPITQDLVISVIGILLLLEVTRRALGPALMIVASVFLAYTFLGPVMPEIIAHKGNSLAEVANHQCFSVRAVWRAAG